ncbi:unnamed protein product [Adineta ricciae]|uniref:EGF-like domain-containing protein n=1 Tax=Adineta ricciae TaxID=249248 RepID=A0A813WTN0_ADIRI|nr:unnamed protein product [Adineta ricciae]CAF1467686.1 unnamed protein product [Adineta ricciae]
MKVPYFSIIRKAGIRQKSLTASSIDATICWNGHRWSFDELLKNEISPWDILSWSSSVEKAADYARVFYNRSEIFEEDSFLCNCTEGFFGRWCEYTLLFDSSLFSKALKTLFHAHTNSQERQNWGKIVCYLTIPCNYGKLCLDWRNICDGQQNCLNGIDEDNCDLLEFNECEADEYRCTDGMCIAEEYWIDGMLDHLEGDCVTRPLAVFCDDLKCPAGTWSCGDGECILHFNRYIYQTAVSRTEGCFNMRECNHMCELDTKVLLWSKPDGLCVPFGYTDTSLSFSSNINVCVFLIRCAFSKGAEIRCPCNGTNCDKVIKQFCGFEGWFPYPQPSIIRPWFCTKQFRCRTGQCISKDWVCDREWDCSDASDEFGLPEKWTENYKTLPFRDFCDFDSEYPCYRASVPNPLNITVYSPCINVTQIGDGIIDCYEGLDEKNTLEDCAGNMLGFTLRCEKGCDDNVHRCASNRACSASLLCTSRGANSSWCGKAQDFICLNGSCVENARCDGTYQCPYGEDEHWCTVSHSYYDNVMYRSSKYITRNQINRDPNIPFCPQKTPLGIRKNQHTLTSKQTHSERIQAKTSSLSSSPQFVYSCNQGFPLYIPSENYYRCACPPTYYGTYCEYFADCISIITHLDLNTLPPSLQSNLLTVAVYFDFSSTVIDHHLFHVNPSLEMGNPNRHRFHLIYSRSNKFMKHKQQRYSNRADIINHHPYSNVTHDPCANNTCNSKSICRPTFRGIIDNANYPLCICPLGHFGPRCYLKNEACKTNPCGLNSTCYPSYDPSGEKPFICKCANQFYGDQCQYEKLQIQIRINMTAAATASSVQFYGKVMRLNALYLFHQQIMHGVPNIIHYNHDQQDAPGLGVLKIYQKLSDAKYFLPYMQPSNQPIKQTVTK